MDQNNANQNLGGNTEENEKEYQNMAALLKEEGLGLDLPKAGEIKQGTIASITPGQIMVGIGAKSEGIIGGQEFELISPDVFASLEVGQEIPVYIITPEDHHGNLLLSYVRALEAETWVEAKKLMDEDGSFTGKVIGYNRGGLLVTFNELRGFVPASQLAFSRRADINGDTPEKRFGHLMGQELSLQIIEVDQERRRLIFSERAALNESRESIRDQVIDKIEIGDVRTGRVTSLADFGAFVNINGADGLVHLSEISWDRIRHPGDALKVGQEVDVEVISIDEVKKHIGLSIRRLLPDPWQEEIKEMRVGQLVEAKITRLTKFGAFAMLENGFEGLIHISELSDEHVEHPKEVLHEDDQVTLRIIKIEPESHRIGLSLRRVESLAFADMDLKALEQELTDTDITVSTDDEQPQAEEEQPAPAADEQPQTEEEQPEPVADEQPQAEEEQSAPVADEQPQAEEEQPAPAADEQPQDDEEQVESEPDQAESQQD